MDETPHPGERARDYVTRIAREKANAATAGLAGEGEIVLAATIG
jgi:predicted house-cleaning NTP pyrophosphatase (Maf/HAM1 superfamily)